MQPAAAMLDDQWLDCRNLPHLMTQQSSLASMLIERRTTVSTVFGIESDNLVTVLRQQ
jgi:hypothetical protein